MDYLKEKIRAKSLVEIARYRELLKKHGDTVVDQVTLAQVFQGMKGVTSLLTLTSKLDPDSGIRYRGYSIPELQEKLPRLHEEGEPLPEGLFYLMITGDMPSLHDVKWLTEEWRKRSYVPLHVFDVIDALPNSSKPMTQFSSAILACATESKFQKAYRAGITKSEYWETTYEDAMNLIAKLPQIAAYIYRKNFRGGDIIKPDPDLDWAANFAHMMGYDGDDIYRLFRMYLFIHADHEGGNVSAHTTHLVSSALSNPYYAYSAGMIGLAGPLHGYANQEVIRWIFDMLDDIGECKDNVEGRAKIANYVKKTLELGKVIPGFGHAVLRQTDPRYMAQKQFANRHVEDNDIINIVNILYDVVPPILESLGKVKNPWPNVDAYSGALLQHYGIKEYFFYTVMFGVSRALGVMSQTVWDRVLGMPIERPKSQPFEWFEKL